MQTYTKGPWRTTQYVENKRTNRKVSYIWGQQVSTIATVENGPREANARLIAAAPELYEAACSAIEALNTGSDSDYVQMRIKAKQILAAALAKADGRELDMPSSITDPQDDGSCDPLRGKRMDDADLGRN